jgi:hypothetical protein
LPADFDQQHDRRNGRSKVAKFGRRERNWRRNTGRAGYHRDKRYHRRIDDVEPGINYHAGRNYRCAGRANRNAGNASDNYAGDDPNFSDHHAGAGNDESAEYKSANWNYSSARAATLVPQAKLGSQNKLPKLS